MATVFAVHAGDYGTCVRIRVVELPSGVTDPTQAVAVDISSATALSMIFLGPRQTRFVVTASFTTDGTDGYMQYVTRPGDITLSGRWQVQGVFAMGEGDYSTDVGAFFVQRTL